MRARLGRLAPLGVFVKAYDYQNGAHRALALQTEDAASGLRRGDDAVWPPQARAYIKRIEELTGVPAWYVSVGTSRDQIIRAA